MNPPCPLKRGSRIFARVTIELRRKIFWGNSEFLISKVEVSWENSPLQGGLRGILYEFAEESTIRRGG